MIFILILIICLAVILRSAFNIFNTLKILLKVLETFSIITLKCTLNLLDFLLYIHME